MKVPRFETFRNLEIVEKEALYSPIRGYYYFPFHNNFTYSEEQLQALKSLNDYINATQNQAQFTLEDGDLLVANNKRVIHGRLPFEDSGNQRRLLLRYWIG